MIMSQVILYKHSTCVLYTVLNTLHDHESMTCSSSNFFLGTVYIYIGGGRYFKLGVLNVQPIYYMYIRETKTALGL